MRSDLASDAPAGGAGDAGHGGHVEVHLAGGAGAQCGVAASPLIILPGVRGAQHPPPLVGKGAFPRPFASPQRPHLALRTLSHLTPAALSLHLPSGYPAGIEEVHGCGDVNGCVRGGGLVCGGEHGCRVRVYACGCAIP